LPDGASDFGKAEISQAFSTLSLLCMGLFSTFALDPSRLQGTRSTFRGFYFL